MVRGLFNGAFVIVVGWKVDSSIMNMELSLRDLIDVLSLNLLSETEKNHKKSQSDYPKYILRFEQVFSRIRVKSLTFRQ